MLGLICLAQISFRLKIRVSQGPLVEKLGIRWRMLLIMFQLYHFENYKEMRHTSHFPWCFAKRTKNDVKIVSNWEFMLKIAQKLIWGETWPNLFLWHLDLNHVMWPTPTLPTFVSNSQQNSNIFRSCNLSIFWCNNFIRLLKLQFIHYLKGQFYWVILGKTWPISVI